VMGVDVAAGIGQDYSALAVVELGSLQPVYIERSNRMSPVLTGRRRLLLLPSGTTGLWCCVRATTTGIRGSA
jgi:hypothetical protein